MGFGLQQKCRTQHSPLQTVLYGAAAGLTATLLLSALSRVLPGMDMDPKSAKRKNGSTPPPEDPFNPRQVQEWQAHSQSPAAYQTLQQDDKREGQGGPPTVTPAGALIRPQSPGPEGLAEQFAFKVASGLFDRDIASSVRPFGFSTHLIYGSAWGALYGILQASYRQPPLLFGALYGLLVWAVGPASLVPAMKLMRPVSEEPPVRTATLVAGHVAYGIAVAEVFQQSEKGASR